MNFSLISIFVLVFFVSGCAPVRVKTESYTYPPVGQVVTRGVGEYLVRQDTGILVPAVEITDGFRVGGGTLLPGEYEAENELSEGVLFSANNELFLAKKQQDKICLYGTETCSVAKFSLKKKLAHLSANSFQQTLLYNGRIGNRITLGYREFSNDMARGAFSNNVDYDLSESVTVGYRGARLEILKATNTDITYRVLSGFGN